MFWFLVQRLQTNMLWLKDAKYLLAKVLTIVPDNSIPVHELRMDKEYRINSYPTADLRDVPNRKLCNTML
jgi:hypothetical protein